MKINFPTTQDGWLKLGGLIFAKSQNLGSEPAINTADADVTLVGDLSTSAKQKLATSVQLHKDAEKANQEALKDIAKLESEIRRVGKVLTGRHQNNRKSMGVWGFTIDESATSAPAIATA